MSREIQIQLLLFTQSDSSDFSKILLMIIRGRDTLSWGRGWEGITNIINMLLLSEEGSTLKGKNLLPRGANSFL